MSPADENIAVFSEQKNLPRFFAKWRNLPLLFHKMLEGLRLSLMV